MVVTQPLSVHPSIRWRGRSVLPPGRVKSAGGACTSDGRFHVLPAVFVGVYSWEAQHYGKAKTYTVDLSRFGALFSALADWQQQLLRPTQTDASLEHLEDLRVAFMQDAVRCAARPLRGAVPQAPSPLSVPRRASAARTGCLGASPWTR